MKAAPGQLPLIERMKKREIPAAQRTLRCNRQGRVRGFVPAGPVGLVERLNLMTVFRHRFSDSGSRGHLDIRPMSKNPARAPPARTEGNAETAGADLRPQMRQAARGRLQEHPVILRADKAEQTRDIGLHLVLSGCAHAISAKRFLESIDLRFRSWKKRSKSLPSIPS